MIKKGKEKDFVKALLCIKKELTSEENI